MRRWRLIGMRLMVLLVVNSFRTEADLSKWQELLTVAIRLAGSCHAAYLKANSKVRRRFNDAVLKAVYVEDGKIKRAEFTDVFAALFSRPSSNKWVKVPPAV